MILLVVVVLYARVSLDKPQMRTTENEQQHPSHIR
jgi:hypothetical protein